MIIKFIIFLLLAVCLNAQTYTLYISSTKYTDVAKKYYFELEKIFPNEDLLIRTHEKPNFSVIIRNIENIEKAKELQNILSTQTTYKNSYIKRYDLEPTYDIVKVKENKPKEEENYLEEYSHSIEDSNKYITAATMYNTKQYQKAYDMFYELFLENNYNININYFLGKSAFNLEKYDEATAAFERVLIQKPDFNQARYDYARILYKLKQNEESKKEFEKLLESEITIETKEEIKKYLNILNKKDEKKKVVAKVMLGLSRSSNVNNGLNSSEYRLPGLNDILVQGEKPIADSAHSEMLNLSFFNYLKNNL
jgi:tetratricopeptide (TPR) repeat protein